MSSVFFTFLSFLNAFSVLSPVTCLSPCLQSCHLSLPVSSILSPFSPHVFSPVTFLSLCLQSCYLSLTVSTVLLPFSPCVLTPVTFLYLCLQSCHLSLPVSSGLSSFSPFVFSPALSLLSINLRSSQLKCQCQSKRTLLSMTKCVNWKPVFYLTQAKLQH